MTNDKPTYEEILKENQKLKEELCLLKGKHGIERAFKAQRLIDQLIIRENSEEHLFINICKLILESGYKLAWIGFLTDDKTLQPIASAGFDKDYLKNIKITCGDDEFSEGPASQAIKTGKYFAMQDIINNPKFKPWRNAAINNGFKSSVAIPLNHENKIYGAINIYSGEQNAFDEEEIKILSMITNDLSIGISNIRYKKTIEKQTIELKKAKKISEESEFFFRSVFENSPIGKSITGFDGSIKTNSAFSNMLGYSHEEFQTKKWTEITHPDDIQKSNLVVETLLKEEKTAIHFEKRYIHKNSSIIFTEVITTLQRDDNGNPIYLITSIINITERKQSELLLKEKKDKIKIQNEELQKAKDKAEESNRLKTAFIQNMSHEIRTPLNAISGFSGMLNKPDLSDEKRKSFVSIIQNSTQQLISIVMDILTISAIETKQEKLNISKTCINNIIVDLLSIFKQQAINQNITLFAKQQLNNSQSEIYTDKTKITQILSNLICNALKFTHKGYIEFGYNLKENDLEFYVKDSGIGIKQELHEKIFERFRQADKSINKLYGGTGLGLAISKAFAELLGGKIWIQSELEKGSTFYFTIPYKPVNEIDKNTTPTKHNEILKTVLVTEDEEYNFLFIEELLIDLDLKLIHAKNGLEAVEIFKTNPQIDLILMDIKMAIMTGDEAAKIIKELKPDLPIVAQSAYALEHELAKYEGVFEAYLTKPINEDDLKKMVMKYIKVENYK